MTKTQKYLVRWYEAYQVSSGGYWRMETFDDEEKALGEYLKHAGEHTEFYVMHQIPIRLSYGAKIKSFLYQFKVPKEIRI